MSYTHLTGHDRYVLGHQHMAGWSLSKISESINRPKGTISRELRRNRTAALFSHDGFHAQGRSAFDQNTCARLYNGRRYEGF